MTRPLEPKTARLEIVCRDSKGCVKWRIGATKRWDEAGHSITLLDQPMNCGSGDSIREQPAPASGPPERFR